MSWLGANWETIRDWARGFGWGVLLYFLVLAALFFIFGQEEAAFVYFAF